MVHPHLPSCKSFLPFSICSIFIHNFFPVMFGEIKKKVKSILKKNHENLL